MDLGTILSGPIGAIFGAGSAIAQKVIEYKDHNAQRTHDLAMRDKDREMAVIEFEHKSEIAKVDADTQVSLREFDAVAASLGADKATYGIGWVDMVRGLVRPAITAGATTLVGYMTWTVLSTGGALSPEQRMELLRESLFLAGTAIAWWFGARSNLGRRAR